MSKWPVTVLVLGFTAMLAAACMGNESIEFKRAYTAGEVVYYNHCQNCHGSSGEGLSALMPPLTDSVYLRQNNSRLACIVKYGINGSLILINKKPYQNQMPPADLAPIEIAQVLTYVKNSFGNKQGLVTLEMVTKDLQGCK